MARTSKDLGLAFDLFCDLEAELMKSVRNSLSSDDVGQEKVYGQRLYHNTPLTGL